MMPMTPISMQLKVLALAAVHLPHKILQVGESPPLSTGKLPTYPINIIDITGHIAEPSSLSAIQKLDGSLELQLNDRANQ